MPDIAVANVELHFRFTELFCTVGAGRDTSHDGPAPSTHGIHRRRGVRYPSGCRSMPALFHGKLLQLSVVQTLCSISTTRRAPLLLYRKVCLSRSNCRGIMA